MTDIPSEGQHLASGAAIPPKPLSHVAPADRSEGFQSELRGLLNRYCAENVSGTPDFVLAEYLVGAVKIYNEAVSRRAEWRGELVEFRPADRVALEPECVHVNVFADPEASAQMAEWLGEAVEKAVIEVFGPLTEAQRTRFEDAVNSAIAKAAQLKREEPAVAVHEQCRKPANGEPLQALIISNQCLRCAGHEGVCTADASEAERMGC